MYMHNALTHNAPCCFYHLKTPCLNKTKKKKILHNKRNKECSLLTPYSAVQGTGCNVAWGETVVWEWRCNTEFKRGAYRDVQKLSDISGIP